jgi:hypothetical protein
VEFPALFSLAEAVVLCPASLFLPGQVGQCTHDNFVSVANNSSSTGEYVNTIVHELTHCKQNRTPAKLTSLQREEEAYQAGIEAAELYLNKAAPWLKR